MQDTLGSIVKGDGQLTEYVRRIFQDSEGRYWFGSNGDGMYRYDGTSLKVYTKKDGLAGMQITGIVEDSSGHIWITTDGGVSRYDGKKFTSYTTKDGLPSNGCWSILIEDDGTVWVGTAAGLCNSRGGEEADVRSFRSFSLPPHGALDTTGTGYWISSIARERNGALWFATRDTGAFRYDPWAEFRRPDPWAPYWAGDSSFQWFTTSVGLPDDELAGAIVDGSDNVWFGSMAGGVTHYSGSMKHWAMPDIGDNEVWTVFEDRDGEIWFSSERFGVYRYDPKFEVRNKPRVVFKGEPVVEPTVPHFRCGLRNYSTEQGLGVLAVQTIHQDRDGRMWFGGGGGLYRLEGDSMVHVKRNGPWR